MSPKPILVIGATGYIGGRLIPRLLEAGYRVRAMARSLAKMGCRPWAAHSGLELAEGDVLSLESVRKATQGCRAVYYLVHSMNSARSDFAEADRESARNLVTAAGEAGVERIIYLGALGRADDPSLSEHLRSRHEVGRILRSGPVPATILQAAMILGSGSASFEMLRYLTDRLPVMLTPRWVRTPVQPIAVTNVLHYLQGCLEHEDTLGQTFDIGGPEVLTYRDLIQLYAEVSGLPRRCILPIPFVTPRLSALWIHLLTPIPSSIAQPLTEGLLNKVVCQEDRIRSIIPQELLDCRETIRVALEKVKQQMVETCWSDAGALLPPEWTYCGDADYSGGTILECGYRVRLDAPAEDVWGPIVSIGGKNGWYFGESLWKLRGWLDRLVGGTGLSRGRRNPSQLYVGDALDFWRVLEVDPPHRLLLLAEMKLPGEAILEFKLTPLGSHRVELQQLSRFVPRGLAGLAYWYVLYPFHEWIFGGMLSSVAKAIKGNILMGPERFTPTLKDACRIDRSGM